MKKIFNPYILSILALSSSLQTLHAAPVDIKEDTLSVSMDTVSSVANVLRDGTRTALQGIGRNAGTISLSAGALVAAGLVYYFEYRLGRAKDVVDNEPTQGRSQRMKTIVETKMQKEMLGIDPEPSSSNKKANLFVVTMLSVLASSLVYGFTKTCGYVGSKI